MIGDLKGVKLKIAINQIKPFLALDSDSSKLTGFESNLVYVLSKSLNFTFELLDLQDNWSRLLPNNTWIGIVGKIVEKTADVGLGCLSVTSDRAQVVDYTYPHFINSVTFTSPKAQHKLYSVSLISPFDTKIWICFVISVTLLTALCLSSERLLRENFHFIWILITILLKQSFNKSSNYGFLSALLMVWIFACFVLTTIYGGCLHSHMSLIREQSSIETVDELIKAQASGRINIIISKGTALHTFIMNSKHGVYHELSKAIKPVKNRWQALDWLKNRSESYAFIGGRQSLDFYIKSLKLLYYTPPPHKDSNLFGLDMLSIAVRKGFRFRQEFNKVIKIIERSGLLDIWQRRYFTECFKSEDYIVSSDEQVFRALNIEQLGNGFIFLVIGSFLSCLLFLIEYILTVNLDLFYKTLTDRK